MTTLFISHSSKDRAWAEKVFQALEIKGYKKLLFIDFHPNDGIHAGSDWEQTLWQRLRQSCAVVALCSANWLNSPWCVAEAMYAREQCKPLFLLVDAEVVDGRQIKEENNGESTTQIPHFLKDRQFVSLGELTFEEVFQRLCCGLEKELPKQAFFPLPERPYPGLAPFRETDAAVFFGRDNEIKTVTMALNRRQQRNSKGFVLVLGASGCGKSSLVRAGVLPRLKLACSKDDYDGPWVITDPIMAGRGLEGLFITLYGALQDANIQNVKSIRERLDAVRKPSGSMQASVKALGELAGDILAARRLPEGLVLFFLDQLEEVFETKEGSDARANLRLLLEVSAGEGIPVTVIATMRSDFLNEFQHFYGAAEHYEVIPLDPMQKSLFGEVIRGPAERFGLRMEPGLVERLVEDTCYKDALPLLAFTLKTLYDKGHEDGKLTMEEYDTLFPDVLVKAENGTMTTYRGVSAAIKKVADDILRRRGFAELPEDDHRMRDLRSAFFRLARVEEGQITKRTARWSDMPDTCVELLVEFEEKRLLVSGAENGEKTLSVAHEALFRVWDTLREWLAQDRGALALCNQIEKAAGEWDQKNRLDSLQWPEERILDALQEIRPSGVSLYEGTQPDIICAFLGPTDPEEICDLLSLTAAEDREKGSGKYGLAWRLPLNHEARGSAGARLALLGDTRPGVGLTKDGLPDIEWCEVEGGFVKLQYEEAEDEEFKTESSRLSKWRIDEENSPYLVTSTADSVKRFAIAKYPITWKQFNAFVEDNGFGNDSWWSGLVKPSEPRRATPLYNNHPAVRLSWFEAVAFCRWLSALLDEDIQLPTEFQWQQAATLGRLDHRYPWGFERDSTRANTWESGLFQTTAVGMYPHGKVADGCAHDITGNVWEWCKNDFNDPRHTSLDGDIEKVVRGGSWVIKLVLCSTFYRGKLAPSSRDYFVGLRPVCRLN